MHTTRTTGDIFEHAAYRLLKKAGLKLIKRNFACKVGEIDLIMKDQAFLVFVEVRYRQHTHFGTSQESITPTKQNKVRKAAAYFLQLKHYPPTQLYRIDAVCFNGDDPGIWIKNAC